MIIKCTTKCMLMARRLDSNGLIEVSDLAASIITVMIIYMVDCETEVDYTGNHLKFFQLRKKFTCCLEKITEFRFNC